MNRKAYYAGQRAASECYLLSGHLLDMHAEQETAEQARDRTGEENAVMIHADTVVIQGF